MFWYAIPHRRCGQLCQRELSRQAYHTYGCLSMTLFLGCASLFPFSLSCSARLCLSILYMNVLCEFFWWENVHCIGKSYLFSRQRSSLWFCAIVVLWHTSGNVELFKGPTYYIRDRINTMLSIKNFLALSWELLFILECAFCHSEFLQEFQ